MSKIAITGLVAVHFTVAVWHGNAHTSLAIGLQPWENAFVILAILIAPLVAAPVVWTRYLRAGVWMFFLSMLGALLFGAYHHYVVVSPDNIGHLPDGSADARAAFIASAGALGLIELASTLYGAFCLAALQRAKPH